MIDERIKLLMKVCRLIEKRLDRLDNRLDKLEEKR
jgi:hypothetical protein